MKCPKCGNEMLIYNTQVVDGKRTPVFVCRNKQCPEFDRRLKKPENDK